MAITVCHSYKTAALFLSHQTDCFWGDLKKKNLRNGTPAFHKSQKCTVNNSTSLSTKLWENRMAKLTQTVISTIPSDTEHHHAGRAHRQLVWSCLYDTVVWSLRSVRGGFVFFKIRKEQQISLIKLKTQGLTCSYTVRVTNVRVWQPHKERVTLAKSTIHTFYISVLKWGIK